MMNLNIYFVFIASRGLGKSYLTALFCVVRCILYPGTTVILAAGTKKQAGMIITEKIEMMKRQSVVLDAEIEIIRDTSSEISCEFKNGSIIQATVSGDGGRGLRGNILIIDEYRIVKYNDLNTVLKPMLTAPRTPGFTFKPEYSDYPIEENKELYLSSAWYKSEWSYKKFKDTLQSMLEGGGEHFCCDIPYLCSLDNKLITKKKLNEDRKSLGKFQFDMEYCGFWHGENEKSFFKFAEINECRVLQTPFYPLTELEILNNTNVKDKNKKYKKQKGEIRIIGADIAIESGEANDNSIYTLLRMLPDGDRYKSEVL